MTSREWSRLQILGLGALILSGCFSVSRQNTATAQNEAPPKRVAVKTGLEVWIGRNFAPLQGKRIGLVTNPTGIASDYRANIDILAHTKGVKLVALFAPEHGVRGDSLAGEEVGNARDPVTGLPVYTLYGKTRKPTAAMLRNLDALVFDIQDIGSRSYTYISTLGLCMEAAAENGVTLCVLDRPNPIGGNRVEGNIPAPEYRSFVGKYPIPYAHGLTLGEFAQMANGEGWLAGGKRCNLIVVPMEGWRRDMTWALTGLPWVLTSPHIPHAETALFYAATGIVGEQPSLNIGVGYTLPFELAGAPNLSAYKMAQELNGRKLKGVFFRPMYWQPFYAAYTNKSCGGVQIHITDPDKAELTRLNFELMDAARRLAPSLNFFPAGREEMFDKVCGTNQVRVMFQEGKSSAEIWRVWNAGSAQFRQRREKYLLYR